MGLHTSYLGHLRITPAVNANEVAFVCDVNGDRAGPFENEPGARGPCPGRRCWSSCV